MVDVIFEYIYVQNLSLKLPCPSLSSRIWKPLVSTPNRGAGLSGRGEERV